MGEEQREGHPGSLCYTCHHLTGEHPDCHRGSLSGQRTLARLCVFTDLRSFAVCISSQCVFFGYVCVGGAKRLNIYNKCKSSVKF